MTGHIRIETGSEQHPWASKVYIDGQLVPGLCAVDLHLDAKTFPTVTLTLEPAVLEVEGSAGLWRKLSIPLNAETLDAVFANSCEECGCVLATHEPTCPLRPTRGYSPAYLKPQR